VRDAPARVLLGDVRGFEDLTPKGLDLGDVLPGRKSGVPARRDVDTPEVFAWQTGIYETGVRPRVTSPVLSPTV